ncbi:hypothetical protein KOW79_013856 [Hemibagrus wyckioides]|uniref:phospholipase A2 n=2 Tax=Hemibagrus wyckioides TaxID=337641 RepID=A0A9D3NI33_9TELE|nr:hypothetical protein KOW79_013856 [Hemibagrus wyckioides]
MLIEPDGPCVDVGHLPELKAPVRRTRDVENIDRRTIYQNNGESFQKLKRSKRAWMIPGTLWCGSGNKASDFSDLGLFEETDKCCREHDHCEQTIASFEFGFGIFNSNFFTLSHCDCDSKFRRCLHKASERMSDMVGYGYFNVLKMRCFEFSQRMECAERTWWGMCKHSHMTTYALLRDATEYNSTFSVVEDDKLDLSIHHTVLFGDLTATNDLVMSSDIVTEDANEKHSSVTVPQWLSVTVNRSQQRKLHGKTVNTHTTDSSKTDKTYSEVTQTDSPITQTTDAPNPGTIYSPKIGTTDSTSSETTGSPKTEATDSTSPETTGSPKTQTTDSPKTEATDSTSPETTGSPKTQTTDSTSPETTGSPKTQTTDSPKTEATDSTSPETTGSPKTQTTDSTSPETTGSPKTQTTDSPKTEATGSPKTQTTDSPKTETTDSTSPETTGSPKTQTTDSPKTEATDSTSSETTSSPKTQTTDSPKTEATGSPKTQTTDLLKTQTRDLPKTKTTASSKPQTTVSPKMHHYPDMHTNQKGKLDICESYKDLDSCRYQIPALREKFGLRNTEHTTMYHCNCTARLARELAEEDEADMVHFWLLDFVSQSCFLLPQNCTGTESCSASSSHDAPVIERWSKGAAVWRHLAAPRRKAKRFNNKRSKRKDSRIRMHKKCLRMHSKLHRTKTFKRKEIQQLYSK